MIEKGKNFVIEIADSEISFFDGDLDRDELLKTVTNT